jgi:hypothetical protein
MLCAKSKRSDVRQLSPGRFLPGLHQEISDLRGIVVRGLSPDVRLHRGNPALGLAAA